LKQLYITVSFVKADTLCGNLLRATGFISFMDGKPELRREHPKGAKGISKAGKEEH
jgi:hypothetical protein